jgi:hypothetical protein
MSRTEPAAPVAGAYEVSMESNSEAWATLPAEIHHLMPINVRSPVHDRPLVFNLHVNANFVGGVIAAQGPDL